MWQQLKAFSHVNMVRPTCWSTAIFPHNQFLGLQRRIQKEKTSSERRFSGWKEAFPSLRVLSDVCEATWIKQPRNPVVLLWD